MRPITRSAVTFGLHLTERDIMESSIHPCVDKEQGIYWIRIDLGVHDICLFTNTIFEHKTLCRLLGLEVDELGLGKNPI